MKKLTVKEKAIAREYVLGKKPGNATEAAFNTYNVKDRTVAKTVGSIIINKPHVQREIELLLETHNLTDDFAMTKLKEGLDANYVANYKGEAYETDIPDQTVRHKYLQDLLKIKEMYPAERSENLNVNVDLQLESMSKDQIKKLLKEELKNYEK